MIFLATKGQDSSSMVKKQIEKGYGFDGFVLFVTRYCTQTDIEKNVEQLLATEFPFVVVNSGNLPLDINQVGFTTSESRSAVKFLLDLGHKRIVLLLGREDAIDSLDELRKYREFHHQYGLDMDEALILYGDYERTVAKGAMLQFLHKGIDCSAVYCITDTMALGVYEALKENHLRIPEDISVVGRHDSFFSNFLSPPLTTVRTQIFEMGVKGAEVLIDAMLPGGRPKKILLDSELILRASTKVWR